MQKWIVLFFGVTLLWVMIGCNGSSSETNDPPPPEEPLTQTQITSPADGEAYTEADTIQFSGLCNDLSEDAMVWTSDADELIGTGRTFASDTLSEGDHLITLTCTYASDLVETAQIAITVTGVIAPLDDSLLMPDTGQQTSFTNTPGEDSDYAIHSRVYTKLDSDGTPLDAGAANWAMVRDDVTGLTWEVKVKNSDVEVNIHDADNTYTWQNAQDIFIAQLNNENFGGFSDWRLPTIKELSTLVDADNHDPSINTDYFPNIISNAYYWSYTSVNRNPEYAWHIYFMDGAVLKNGRKTGDEHVRAVRGGDTN